MELSAWPENGVICAKGRRQDWVASSAASRSVILRVNHANDDKFCFATMTGAMTQALLHATSEGGRAKVTQITFQLGIAPGLRCQLFSTLKASTVTCDMLVLFNVTLGISC